MIEAAVGVQNLWRLMWEVDVEFASKKHLIENVTLYHPFMTRPPVSEVDASVMLGALYVSS